MSYPPPQPGYQPQMPQDHPGAKSAMILGIVALAGGFLCGLPYLVGPFAMVKGKRVMSEIDAAGGQYGGRGQAQTGFILGIVATVLLALSLVFVVIFFAGGGYGEFVDQLERSN